MDEKERSWLAGVAERIPGAGGPIDDEAKRVLLRATKVTADATGIRYLAPLTAFLIGRAAGRADAAGERFDLRGAAEEIAVLAAGFHAPEEV